MLQIENTVLNVQRCVVFNTSAKVKRSRRKRQSLYREALRGLRIIARVLNNDANEMI